MTTLTLELPSDLFERVRKQAEQAKKPIEIVIQESLSRDFPPPIPTSERERGREVLRAAGLLTEPGPEMQRLASEATMTLEEVNAVFARVGGKPLSEIAIEQRGSKE